MDRHLTHCGGRLEKGEGGEEGRGGSEGGGVKGGEERRGGEGKGGREGGGREGRGREGRGREGGGVESGESTMRTGSAHLDCLTTCPSNTSHCTWNPQVCVSEPLHSACVHVPISAYLLSAHCTPTVVWHTLELPQPLPQQVSHVGHCEDLLLLHAVIGTHINLWGMGGQSYQHGHTHPHPHLHHYTPTPTPLPPTHHPCPHPHPPLPPSPPSPPPPQSPSQC